MLSLSDIRFELLELLGELGLEIEVVLSGRINGGMIMGKHMIDDLG
jgi:hypothetical protein